MKQKYYLFVVLFLKFLLKLNDQYLKIIKWIEKLLYNGKLITRKMQGVD